MRIMGGFHDGDDEPGWDCERLYRERHAEEPTPIFLRRAEVERPLYGRFPWSRAAGRPWDYETDDYGKEAA